MFNTSVVKLQCFVKLITCGYLYCQYVQITKIYLLALNGTGAAQRAYC